MTTHILRVITLMSLCLALPAAAQETATATTAAPAPVAEAPKADVKAEAPKADVKAEAPKKAKKADKAKLKWGAWIRAGFRKTFADDPVIGSDDGFELNVARMSFKAKKGPLSGKVQLQFKSTKKLQPQVLDLWVGYKVSPLLQVKLGRFKAPFDMSSVDSTKTRLFVEDTLHSEGVSNTFGVPIGKVKQGRQLGLMAYAKRPLKGTIDVTYMLAFTNGMSSPDRNTDGHWGGYSRLSLHLDKVEIGGAFFLTGRQQPGGMQDLMGQSVFLRASYFGLDFQAEQILVTEETGSADKNEAFAVNGQLIYNFGRYFAGYRGEYYNPWKKRPQVEHSALVGVLMHDKKLRLVLNGSVVTEVERESVNNNRLWAYVQYNY